MNNVISMEKFSGAFIERIKFDDDNSESTLYLYVNNIAKRCEFRQISYGGHFMSTSVTFDELKELKFILEKIIK
jgi:hypothetical protein